MSQGTVLSSRYEIVSLVGRGGMGAVYRAHDRLLDEDVAIKILRADMAGDPELAQRLRSEIKLARTVSHWNVCRVHEYGEDGTLRFISMELVQGANLKERVQKLGPLPWEEAFAVCEQAAEGLEAIHRAGIVHRDLTTANLMIDGSGRVRVMDFGIAKRAAAAGGAGTPYVVGSPEYMSPEQARGRTLDARSDIYALGVVAFELFTGVLPFKGDSPVATLLMHLEAPPPLDGEAAQRLPASLVPVLRSVLAKDPAARPGNARALAELFRGARADGGHGEPRAPMATPVAAQPTLVLPGRGLRARPSTVLVSLVALAVLAWGVSQLMTVTAPMNPVPSPTPAVPTSPAPGPAEIRPSPRTEPTPVLDAPILRSPRPNPFSSPPSSRPAVTASPPDADRLATPEPQPPADVPPVTVAPAPSATPPSSPAAAEAGWLRLAVKPWAEVTIDGRPVGQTPLARIELFPGSHAVVLTHPSYRPYHRRVTVEAGKTSALVVDLTQDGIPR